MELVWAPREGRRVNVHLHVCPTCSRKHECSYPTCTPPYSSVYDAEGNPSDWPQDMSPDPLQCERCCPGAAEAAYRREILRRLRSPTRPPCEPHEWSNSPFSPQLYSPRFGPFIDAATNTSGQPKRIRDAVSNMRNRRAVREKRQELRRQRLSPTRRRR